MKEEIIKDLISFVMTDKKVDMQSAFDIVYTSELFAKLDNPATGLYYQSSGYVYSYLKDELHL